MPSPKLDRIDVNILVQLQRDGRMINAQLADAVGLSPSPCLLRVKRLQRAGYITGYNAQINLAKLGESVTIYLEVTLNNHRKEDFVRFEASMRRIDEVIECHLISGGYDYLVKMVVPGLAHFQTIMEALLEGNVGISRYFSYIVLKTPISKPEYPLRLLFQELS